MVTCCDFDCNTSIIYDASLQEVQVDHIDPRIGVDHQSAFTPNWTITVSDIRTVKVSNISLAVTERDIKEFFLSLVIYNMEAEKTQLAYVTFKNSQGADTAVLLTGATIADLSVSINLLTIISCPGALPPSPEEKLHTTNSAVKKGEDVVSTMLAKGFVLGKDAINKAKAFDEQHHLVSNASATVASIDRKMGLSEKLSIGTAVVNEKVKEMDERYQVFEKTKSALAIAEQKASIAGSAIMNNHYVATGASWVSSALSMVTKAAEDVSVMTREKVERAEEEKKEIIYREKMGFVNEYAQIHLDESPAGEPPIVPVDSVDDCKLGMI
ncbi:Binding partner of ACD11 1 [Vitis vinifera]|uniref:Binding partner of ACD11 1 n=1 Tax=Vitis vinifera TaxID=29760 RepID=A0A438DGN2_VITVI|nr:Binding partner of ACD11 1 [Vitis vinifera]